MREDLMYKDWPVCPHCGHQEKFDLYPVFAGDDEEIELECEGCGGTFLAEMHIRWTTR